MNQAPVVPVTSVIHDDAAQQFRVRLAGGLDGVLRYEWADEAANGPRVMRLMHAFVPEALRGHAQGGVLMEAVLTEIRAMGVLVTPICGYTQTYMTRHAARWGHLLAA
jgi:predicted GNAT family acetyltransferase